MRTLLLLLGIVVVSNVAVAQTPNIQLEYRAVAPGRLTKVTVQADHLVQVRAAFLGAQYLFVPGEEQDTYWGLITAPLDAEPGYYRLSLLLAFADGTTHYTHERLRVVYDAYVSRDFPLPGPLYPLGDTDVYLNEQALLQPHLSTLSEPTTWQREGLIPPFYRSPSAPFGTYRRINGSWQRHTGIDYPKALGTPVSAAGDGRVALVARFPIRGRYVLLDHGAGLFSGYAHLSAIYVEQGMPIQQGEIIGAVGSSGRSTGSHLHWELAVGGEWVDPTILLSYLTMN